jgi:hypothetical protein
MRSLREQTHGEYRWQIVSTGRTEGDKPCAGPRVQRVNLEGVSQKGQPHLDQPPASKTIDTMPEALGVRLQAINGGRVN